MPHYTTSLQAMAAGATRVDNANHEIQGQITALRSEVETMMGGWRGDAAAAFVQVHEAFETQANTITASLRRMHDALSATRATYGSQESSQTQTLTGLAARMTG